MTEDPPAAENHPGGNPPSLEILIQDQDWLSGFPGLKERVQSLIEKTFLEKEIFPKIPGRAGTGVELSLCFAGDDFVRRLNRQFRDRDKPTNVLSFPSRGEEFPEGENGIHLGDIVLAFGVVSKEARDQGKPLSDHTLHLVLHGFLHLLGFSHEDRGEASKMEDLEIRLLKSFGIPNPYE